MSELVQITDNSLATNFAGGFNFGGDSGVFRLKPAQVELQQKTSRSEGSQEGKFRNGLTGEHYDSIHAVLIFMPTESRSCYENDNDFGVPPLCYSMDAKRPSDNAKQPQALSCSSCKQSDWSRWKKTKAKDDLPKCKNRWNMFVVDRETQIPFKIAVRGKSIAPFLAAMATIRSMAEKYRAKHGKYPELHDFSFKITTLRKVDNKGVYYVMVFSDIAMIREEDREAFGALYLEFAKQREQYQQDEEIADTESSIDEAVTESAGSGKTIDAAEIPTGEEVTI